MVHTLASSGAKIFRVQTKLTEGIQVAVSHPPQQSCEQTFFLLRQSKEIKLTANNYLTINLWQKIIEEPELSLAP